MPALLKTQGLLKGIHLNIITTFTIHFNGIPPDH